MLWLLALHIATLALWSASLLYLPTLLASGGDSRGLARLLFTHLATPAGLLAIIAGTLLFLIDRNTSAWLLVKLGLVTALVSVHGLVAVLILRLDAMTATRVRRCGVALAAAAGTIMISIIWLVLAKPALPTWQ